MVHNSPCALITAAVALLSFLSACSPSLELVATVDHRGGPGLLATIEIGMAAHQASSGEQLDIDVGGGLAIEDSLYTMVKLGAAFDSPDAFTEGLGVRVGVAGYHFSDLRSRSLRRGARIHPPAANLFGVGLSLSLMFHVGFEQRDPFWVDDSPRARDQVGPILHAAFRTPYGDIGREHFTIGAGIRYRRHTIKR